ncbi:SANT and BTB domain regulator of class switch recombination [Prorops nasuta]|uniref:SANT and BTB domain regulator of class switch recombination n=1 Tax=Prorops nasuta TaxID=863751 RepID=UPI0034CE64CD
METNKSNAMLSESDICVLLGPHKSPSKGSNEYAVKQSIFGRSFAEPKSVIPAMNLSDNYRFLNYDEYPKVSTRIFFDFLKTAFQVNDSFEGAGHIITDINEINWSKLGKINLDLYDTNDNIESDVTAVTSDLVAHGKCLTNQSLVHRIEICKVNKNKQFNKTEYSKKSSISNFVQCVASYTLPVRDKTLWEGNIINKCVEQINRALELKAQHNYSNNEKPTGTIKELNNLSLDCKVEEKKKKSTKSEQNSVIHKEPLLSEAMKKSLSDILHEGLLDSILPYMLPKQSISQPIIKKSMTSLDVKKNNSLPNNTIEDKIITASPNKESVKEKNKSKKSTENEVEIHVCDEAKNIKKDFRCPQKLLVQKMCYFADVTAGQKLEEIDISVHCDIVIFDWLMRWVKKDFIRKSEWPILEVTNVVPIMVSASFLQMEPLLDACLEFCYKNMSDILRTSTVLTCLSDNLITRLADLFSNDDVESLKDKKDKIQSRLFCKLIASLTNPMPDNKKGHYSSLATLFKCSKCGKNVIRPISDLVPCIPSAMKIDNKGNVYSKHTRDFSWTLSDYIAALRSELRSWRKVYWRLWADCHFLYCQHCVTYYPAHQTSWCCYHPESPQFFINEQQRPTPFPLGRYPCCSQRAYRFEVLLNRDGCRYKEHSPEIKTQKDMDILDVYNAHKEIFSIDPPQLFFPEKITRLVARDPSLKPGKLMCKEPMPWNGIEIMPPRTKLGLLAKIWGGQTLKRSATAQDSQKNMRRIMRQASQITSVSSPSSSIITESDEDEAETGYDDSSIEEESYCSEESNALEITKAKNKIKGKTKCHVIKREIGRCWNANLGVRYNQDNQRDFEEKAIAQMVSLLTKRTSSEFALNTKSFIKYNNNWRHNQPSAGGTYIKLEAEFRDQWVQSTKFKNSFFGKNVTRPRQNKV